MSEIVLVGINSRYTHTSFGLRYLYANLHELRSSATIQEYVIKSDPSTIAEKILAENPRIVGIGVYIWNAADVHDLIEILKKIAPETKIVLGGPEVSHQPFRINWQHADYIVQGEGEVTFYKLCREILDNTPLPGRFFRRNFPYSKSWSYPTATTASMTFAFGTSTSKPHAAAPSSASSASPPSTNGYAVSIWTAFLRSLKRSGKRVRAISSSSTGHSTSTSDSPTD